MECLKGTELYKLRMLCQEDYLNERVGMRGMRRGREGSITSEIPLTWKFYDSIFYQFCKWVLLKCFANVCSFQIIYSI